MRDTPNANRLHIGLFGRRNAGKSSLINVITGQDIALVSDFLGTTTDPVYKAMELPPIGPVVIIDTAGLDDTGELGKLRIKKTEKVMNKTDLALLVFTPENSDLNFETEWYNRLQKHRIPIIGVLNKSDYDEAAADKLFKFLQYNFHIPFIKVSAKTNKNINKLKEAIQLNAPTDFEKETIVGDILAPKSKVILVAPQDIEAPKGRLILPQVQVIRDILDHDCLALTVKDSELSDMLECLKGAPDLVITDSQVFAKVNKILPEHIPLTSFSILMARYKGDLKALIEGAEAIDKLKPGDKILIAEACTHHALKNDIGRDKIPRWLKNKVGGDLDITVKAGVDFPEDLTPYDIIIHCGSCMFNRKQFISRLMRAQDQNIPMTNYGIAIAHLNGILKKVTCMFF